MTYLTDDDGAITKAYEYDAFGNEENPAATDTNPFRYAGEYYDKETGTYYLRARYYDPVIGRFTQEDPHWNQSNMLYGDDPLKLNNYTYAPSLAAIIQSGNLYVYAMSNPTRYTDPDGEFALAAFLTQKAAKVAGSMLFEGLITGIAYKSDGKSFREGFTSGAVSGFWSGVGSLIGPDGSMKRVIGIILTSAVGSVMGTAVDDFHSKETAQKYSVEYVLNAALKGLGTGVLSAYLDNAVYWANKPDSVAKALTEYDDNLGKWIKEIFGGATTLLASKEEQ